MAVRAQNGQPQNAQQGQQQQQRAQSTQVRQTDQAGSAQQGQQQQQPPAVIVTLVENDRPDGDRKIATFSLGASQTVMAGRDFRISSVAAGVDLRAEAVAAGDPVPDVYIPSRGETHMHISRTHGTFSAKMESHGLTVWYRHVGSERNGTEINGTNYTTKVPVQINHGDTMVR